MADRTDTSAAGSGRRDIVVVGASAGGVEALTDVVGGLPAIFPASLFVVLHVSPEGTSVLPQILNRKGRLPASHPSDGERIRSGRIYVAPPDRHLVLDRGVVRTPRGPKENGFRPAIDTLFRSAAFEYGPRTIGVVLSGGRDDGTIGLQAIKTAGGTAVVLDPEDTVFPSMPRSAVENVDVDHVVPLADIAGLLVALTGAPAAIEGGDLEMEEESKLGAPGVEGTLQDEEIGGERSDLVCPECGGTLWETEVGEVHRYRCRVGHAYGPESLLAQHSEALESALWTAVRTLEERVAILNRLADTMDRRGSRISAAALRRRLSETEEQSDGIRSILEGVALSPEALEEDEVPTGTES